MMVEGLVVAAADFNVRRPVACASHKDVGAVDIRYSVRRCAIETVLWICFVFLLLFILCFKIE